MVAFSTVTLTFVPSPLRRSGDTRIKMKKKAKKVRLRLLESI
jgi:hypothetical protein